MSFRLSTWQVVDANGAYYEEIGIQPDIEVNTTQEQFDAGEDAQMEAALEHLRSLN